MYINFGEIGRAFNFGEIAEKANKAVLGRISANKAIGMAGESMIRSDKEILQKLGAAINVGTESMAKTFEEQNNIGLNSAIKRYLGKDMVGAEKDAQINAINDILDKNFSGNLNFVHGTDVVNYSRELRNNSIGSSLEGFRKSALNYYSLADIDGSTPMSEVVKTAALRYGATAGAAAGVGAGVWGAGKVAGSIFGNND